MKDLPDLSAFQAFVSVVDAGSLTRAAAELGIPRTTIARRLTRLEEDLGVRLIKRTTRSLHVTDAGESMYHHASNTLDAARRAMASVSIAENAPLKGPLRVSLMPQMPPSFQQMIASFVRAHPDVRLKLNYDTRYVDLWRDHYDVVMRAGQDFEPGLIARTLFRTTHMLVASPDYLARHQVPESVDDLSGLRCLMGFSRGETPHTHWPLRDGGKVAVEGVFFSNNLDCVRTLVCAGEGVALLPQALIYTQLERGELVKVLEDVVGADVRIALLFPDRELLPPQVRAFIDMTLVWVEEQHQDGIKSGRPRGAPWERQVP